MQNCKHKSLVKNKPIELLFVGTMAKNKRLKLLVRHCAKTLSVGDKLNVICRYGGEPTKLTSKNTFLKFIGKVDHEKLPEYYRKATIFVLLSRKETFGISYIESMSQGTPIIFAKGEAIDGTFNQGEVGYSIVANSVTQFKEAIKNILDNYEQISENCIEKSKDFSDFVIINEWDNLYNNTIKNHE